MSVQVVVKQGDRTWDAIRETDDSAMFRVSEHMKKDATQGVAAIGDLVQWKLIFGKGVQVAKELLEAKGFEVTIKELNQGE